MKNLTTLMILLLTCSVFAQDLTTDSTSQFSKADGAMIGHYLQLTGDVNRAVYLTQSAWQLTHSFSTGEQLAEQWRMVLDHNVEPLNDFPTVNSHAYAGQWLIQYTDGMTLDQWRLIDIPGSSLVDLGIQNLSKSQKFSIFVNLQQHWRQILEHTDQQLNWLTIPNFKEPPQFNSQGILLQTVLSLLKEKRPTYQIVAQSNAQGIHSRLTTALLRQSWHREQGNLLAYYQDWIDIYQQIEFSTQLLGAGIQLTFTEVITEANSWWISQTESINYVDDTINSVLTLLLIELPKKFKNPDHFNTQLNQALFVYLWKTSDPANYANHPLRRTINNQLEVCLNLSQPAMILPPDPITNEQFISCINEAANWGLREAQSTVLSGELMILENSEAWSRVLQTPYFQSINYIPINSLSDTDCRSQIQKKSNPLEWLLAAETFAWLHDRWPGLSNAWPAPEQTSHLLSEGQQIFQNSQCLTARVVLNNQYEQLKTQWQQLKKAIIQYLENYRVNHLAAGSQVDFFKPVTQFTELSPQDVYISPCDVKNSCGAFIELKASSSLLDLFPNHLKMAQQLGLGTLEICYDQVQWRKRAAERTHLNNNKIANYTGQLSFQLIGKYDEQIVFSKQIVGKNRHLYLFGENTKEVLDMPCPLPIIGKQIITQLDRGTYGLFPNRLTFLTAQRIDVNHVLNSNWVEGEGWQSKLADENHSHFISFNELPEINQKVTQQFAFHNDQVQQQVYRTLSNVNLAGTNDSELSSAVFEYNTQRKKIEHVVSALYPDLWTNPQVSAALRGNNRLVDQQFFNTALSAQQHLLDMLNQGDQLFSTHRQVWQELPDIENSQMFEATWEQLKDVQSRLVNR